MPKCVAPNEAMLFVIVKACLHLKIILLFRTFENFVLDLHKKAFGFKSSYSPSRGCIFVKLFTLFYYYILYIDYFVNKLIERNNSFIFLKIYTSLFGLPFEKICPI